jgi:hypothetical protein
MRFVAGDTDTSVRMTESRARSDWRLASGVLFVVLMAVAMLAPACDVGRGFG